MKITSESVFWFGAAVGIAVSIGSALVFNNPYPELVMMMVVALYAGLGLSKVRGK